MKTTSKLARILSFGSVAIPFTVTPARAQTDNTPTGVNTLTKITTGSYNTATGANALRNDTSGSYNTGTGRGALYRNSDGTNNTATGFAALYSNTLGTDNTAEGASALGANTTGNNNTAEGASALGANTTGNNNTAVGFGSLSSNVNGFVNTAIGYSAMSDNTTGAGNVALGAYALDWNWTGEMNTAVGTYAGVLNIDGVGNTSVGSFALHDNRHGDQNTAVGDSALYSIEGHDNTAVGRDALVTVYTGNYNTAVGTLAGATCVDCSNTGAFGYLAQATASGTIRIGNASITQIGGAVGWSNLSDGRYKTNVRENVPGLEFIGKLKPVTFNWKLSKLNETDGVEEFASDPRLGEAREAKAKKLYTGFIAQDVEAAARECGFDFSGIVRPENEQSRYHLTYAEFVVPLVRAVQEQQQQIDELRKTVRALASDPRLHDGRLGTGRGPGGSRFAGVLDGTWSSIVALVGGLLLLSRLKWWRATPVDASNSNHRSE